MERNTMEIISAAYTTYALLNPSDRVLISIDSFAESFMSNLSFLQKSQICVSETNAAPPSEKQVSSEKAEEILQKGYREAEQTLGDEAKMSSLLEKLKSRMKSLPMVGNVLSNVPTMFKLLNHYLKGEYKDIPQKELIIIISAASYLIAPIDLIPDFIPVVGLVDDMAVVSVCIKSTRKELDKYLCWRKEHGFELSDET